MGQRQVEGDTGPQLLSPAQVVRAKALLIEKEEIEQQRRRRIENRKAERAAAREQKAWEKNEQQ